jgi:hypothetical protein
LICLENPEALKRINLTRRETTSSQGLGNRQSLAKVVENVIATVEIECHPD